MLTIGNICRPYHSKNITVASGQDVMSDYGQDVNFKTECSFYNYLGTTATVVNRWGLRVELPFTPRADLRREFVVSYTLSFSYVIKEQLVKSMGSLDSGNPALRALKSAFFAAVDDIRNGDIRLKINFGIDYDTLAGMGGTVYFHDADIVLTLESGAKIPFHPASEEAALKRTALKAYSVEEDRYGFFDIQIIDNNLVTKDMYISISNEVYKITPVADVTRIDGIYLTTQKPLANGMDWKNVPEVRRYELNEDNLKELKLYHSYAEAITSGNEALINARELAELNHEVAKAKAETAKAKELTAVLEEKIKTHRDIIQAEKERAALETDRIENIAAIERVKTKDHYEERSYQRKDTSEVVKVLPTIALGIGAAVMALKGVGGVGRMATSFVSGLTRLFF